MNQCDLGQVFHWGYMYIALQNPNNCCRERDDCTRTCCYTEPLFLSLQVRETLESVGDFLCQ